MTDTLTQYKEPNSFFDANEAVLPSTREQQILDWCKGKFGRARTNRRQFERIWYMNLAFYFGRQYVQWTATRSAETQRLYEPPVPPWRVRHISNRIRPIIRKEIANIVKEKPQAFVIPSSSQDEDIFAAHGAEACFDFLWRELHLNRLMRRSAFWTVMCGSSFMKDWYDAEKPDSNGVPGLLQAEPVSPFHLYVPDTQEEELENQPYLFHVLAKDHEWVGDNYGKRVTPDSSGSAGVLEQRFLSAVGINTNIRKDMVAVHEAWIKPNARFPDGAVVAWAGETLLHVQDGWPYNHKEYPFVKFDHIPSGKFYGDSVIPDLIPLQKELNRTRSQIIESKNRMSKPQLVAPRGSVDPNKITSEPGLIVFYTPGYQPPQPIPLQSIPSYVVQELDRCVTDMSDIASQHEITRGQTPPGVTAATAIAYLQEEDSSVLAGTISSLEEGIEKLGRHFLSNIQQFWTAQHAVKVMGQDGAWETQMFGKADLRGNTDLRIEAGSAMPRSRAGKQAFIMDLMDKGAIPPERGLKYLEMAETGKLYEEMQLDARHAQRENIRLKNGENMPPNDFDNHEIHIIEHNNYRKRHEFESLPDEIKMMFQQHVEMHKMGLVMQQTGQSLPPGMPVPGGNPSRPQSQPGQAPPPQ